MRESPFMVLLPYVVSCLISAGMGIYAWRHRRVVGAVSFTWFGTMQALTTLGFVLELVSPTLDAKIFWDNVQFGTLFAVSLAFWSFAQQFAERPLMRPRLTWGVLWGLAGFMMLLIFTDPLHGWTRTMTMLQPGEPFDLLTYEFTPLFYATIIYDYVLLVSGLLMLFRRWRSPEYLYREQAQVILLGMLIPIAGSVLTFLGITIWGQRDLTPFTFALGNIIIGYGLFRYHIFDLTPVARSAAVESMQDAVLVLDLDGRLMDLNPAAQKLLAVPVTAAIGLPIHQLFWDWSADGSGAENGAPQILNVEGENGRFRYEISIQTLRSMLGQVSGQVVMLHDVTAREKARAEREALITELEAKNTELERFTYMVSHDLKSPLLTMRGFLGFLTQDIERQRWENVSHDVTRIREAVANMEMLLEDLLQLSRAGHLVKQPEEIPFAEVVRSVLAAVAGRIALSGAQVHVAPDLPIVLGERRRLVQVLQNLVENGLKYMGNQSQPVIEIGWQQQAGEALFFVRDNGAGIDPANHEKVFDLFERLDQTIEGTGIGLATVKRIVEVHHGRIWVESEGAGQGSVFYFTLPCA
ncbi:MAG: PAS domain-containing protein [Ardenticatenaceae bacterium]|nr:PAS domain-containing protein [Ardenticatenaceae bacterium]